MRLAQRLRDAIAARTGLWFDEGKLPFLGEVLERRAAALHLPADSYLAALEANPTHELRELAKVLTVGETYFFRHGDQFRAFAEIAVPARLAAHSNQRSLSVLSAGCASGEEPYSLAILLREQGLDSSTGSTVLGMDLNPAALERAQRARYAEWSLRETPQPLRERWFTREGNSYVLAPTIRAAVQFQERNLGTGESALLGAERFDVIFCRNLLMYFEPARAQRLVDALAVALAPGGYLFLGHAETLRGLSNDFHLCHTHDTFYYQRKPRLHPAPPPPRASPGPGQLAPPPADWAQSWVEAVQRTSERIRALSEGGAPAPSPDPPRATFDLSPALALLEAERFAEALAVLPAGDDDGEVALLRAVLLTHTGRLAEARAACARVLELDSLAAGAHYLLALCAEGEQRLAAAVEHDQTAVYLDPTFAMPHLHLGLMARRGGDREVARRELSEALLLLQRDDASRVLLYGGGFRREALTSLCRAELDRLEKVS